MWLLVRIESAPLRHARASRSRPAQRATQAVILFQGNYVDVMITIG